MQSHPPSSYTVELQSAIRHGLSKSSQQEVFQVIMDHVETLYQRPCHNINQLSKRNTKSKGNVFEQFCVLYLTAKMKQWKHVWLLSDVPENVLQQLSLGRNDVGIDIVGVDFNQNYYAIQAKYRNPSKFKQKTFLPWTVLSTFYALCARTGPWKKQIVMSNVHGVRRNGQRNEKDATIALGSFKSTKRSMWLEMIGDQGHSLISPNIEAAFEEKTKTTHVINNTSNIREIRSQYFAPLTAKK